MCRRAADTFIKILGGGKSFINTLPLISFIKMECFTAKYYDQAKDYLHPHLHDFVHYYRRGNVFDLPLYHGYNNNNNNKIEMERGN